MGRRASYSAAALLLAVLALLILAAPGCSDSSQAVASPCPPGSTCQVRLTILHTSDIHSRLFPYEQVITQIDGSLGLGSIGDIKRIGGVARMSYILNRERARADRAIHVDSGDCFQGAPIFNFFNGEPEVRVMSAMGTDAAVIANHEFDKGINNLVTQMTRWSNYGLLTANYQYDTIQTPGFGSLQTVASPFAIYNREGIKIAVIGMANLSSLSSIFDTPNRLGITPLPTPEVAQFYADLLRPYVDLIVMVSHLGLENDQYMIRNTTGIDIVMGGHNHIVVNPPQEIRDCSADPQNPGYVWAVDPNLNVAQDAPPPNDELHPDPVLHPYQFKRACTPRKVFITHSGAFSKYVGRMDLILSNDPKEVTPTSDPKDYEPINGFEIVSTRYTAFPIDEAVPEDPVIVNLLEPYRRGLDLLADLDTLVGYSPLGSRRFGASGGDSPLGNMVASAMWLRLGVQTDFSMTNSTGVRADLNPGVVTLEQMYNIFPFDNSVSKMQLSGGEVQELFDFIARRSAGRGCSAQSQIAGARARINCSSCSSVTDVACETDENCEQVRGTCDTKKNLCVVKACAEQVYIGHQQGPDGNRIECKVDKDCAENLPRQCDLRDDGRGLCLSPIKETSLYELATSNYLAGGGSGFRVLQRNTTQFDTKIQQRDALTDYLRAGKPCGSDDNGELPSCEKDSDCSADGAFVCACPNAVESTGRDKQLVCTTSKSGCSRDQGKCVRADCRTLVAQFHDQRCKTSADRETCEAQIGACKLGGESCKVLSCIDNRLGNFTDNRLEMIGR